MILDGHETAYLTKAAAASCIEFSKQKNPKSKIK